MKSERLTIFLALVAINLFGLGLLYLGGIGKLIIYIHPSSQWFVILTGFLFLLLNIRGLFGRESPVFERNNLPGIFSLFVVALLIFFVKPVPLSVETARSRISGATNPTNAQSIEHFTTRKTSDFGIVDWLAAFANPEKAYRYENMPADITGFLLIKDGQSMVGRLVITCCGADAQPAVLQFHSTEELPKENTWIRIKGMMHAIDAKPVLEVTSLEIVPEPKNPYAQ